MCVVLVQSSVCFVLLLKGINTILMKLLNYVKDRINKRMQLFRKGPVFELAPEHSKWHALFLRRVNAAKCPHPSPPPPSTCKLILTFMQTHTHTLRTHLLSVPSRQTSDEAPVQRAGDLDCASLSSINFYEWLTTWWLTTCWSASGYIA